MRLSVDWDDFRKYCFTQIHMKQSTFKVRCRYLRHLSGNGVDVSDPNSVYTYFNNRISNGVKPSSLNCYVKALNNFYLFSGLDHHFKLFRSFEKPLKIPTSGDIGLLLKSCPRTKTGKMLKSAIFFLVHTGLRNQEFCNLRFDNVDWVHNEIRLVGKWDRERVIPVKDYVLKGKYYPSLCNYIDHHRAISDTDFVFVDDKGNQVYPTLLRRLVKSAARRCGIGWLHPHSFRHYYATMLLSKGVNVKIVQLVLGHGNISETSRYLHAVELDIRKAIDNVSFDSLLKSELGFEGLNFDLTNLYGGI